MYVKKILKKKKKKNKKKKKHLKQKQRDETLDWPYILIKDNISEQISWLLHSKVSLYVQNFPLGYEYLSPTPPGT